MRKATSWLKKQYECLKSLLRKCEWPSVVDLVLYFFIGLVVSVVLVYHWKIRSEPTLFLAYLTLILVLSTFFITVKVEPEKEHKKLKKHVKNIYVFSFILFVSNAVLTLQGPETLNKILDICFLLLNAGLIYHVWKAMNLTLEE